MTHPLIVVGIVKRSSVFKNYYYFNKNSWTTKLTPTRAKSTKF